ncbi:MAG: response regulator [Phycisphaerales bacterium]|nr:MAG: response regulator [Phycisphaerales bacterium]
MRDGKYVILYIEDDPDYRDSLRLVLEANGYLMEEAASAEDGLNVFKECQPDLIIVDLMMEEVDAGTSFVKELKMLGNTAPVYMLSSVGDNLSQTINAADLGLTGVFQKPIDADSLIFVLKTVLK